MKKIRLATVWLDGCSGCHMSLLDIDEGIEAVLQLADLVYGPLVDAQEFPEGVDVTLVEGAVSSQNDLKELQTIRARTKVLVSLGDCAVSGNVPSMRNSVPVPALLHRIYVESPDTNPGIPVDGVPALLKYAVPLQDFVKVDLHVPGCPPAASAIRYVIGELVAGRKPELAGLVKFG
jgi:NAD-reducing hydrogenase small subunit